MDLDRWQEIYFTLKQHKLRTALTAFGVFWGIFMLVILLGAGNSLQAGAMQGFGGHTNTIFLWTSSKTQIPYKGLQPGRRMQLDDADLAALRTLPELGRSSSVNELGGWQVAQYIVRGDKSGTFTTRGVEPDIFPLSGFKVLAGRAINDFDFSEKRKVAIIGNAVQDILFTPEEDPVGQDIKIGGINFTIIGVYKERDGNNSETDHILMPNSTLRTTFNQSGWIGHFQLQPVAGVHASVLEEKARKILMERHRVHPDDKGVFGTFNMQNEFDKVNALFIGISVFSWTVAIGTIFAGVVGVGNIMLIIVKERTREIGLHKALGATSGHIIGTILLETLVLTFVAGYFGLAAGVFLLEGITGLLNGQEGAEMFAQAEIDFKTATIALITLIFAGGLAAILPATKAARVDPIVALQDE